MFPPSSNLLAERLVKILYHCVYSMKSWRKLVFSCSYSIVYHTTVTAKRYHLKMSSCIGGNANALRARVENIASEITDEWFCANHPPEAPSQAGSRFGLVRPLHLCCWSDAQIHSYRRVKPETLRSIPEVAKFGQGECWVEGERPRGEAQSVPRRPVGGSPHHGIHC